MSMTWKSAGWLLGLGALAAWGITQRLQQQQVLAQESLQMQHWQVATVRPQPPKDVGSLVLPGQLQAWTETPIYAHSSGFLKRWNVDIGTRVKAGELIAELSIPDVDAQLLQAQAQLRQAQADEELARVTAARYAKLLPTQTVSPQDVDNHRLDAAAKLAALESARANLNRLQALDSFRRIEAPEDGVLTVRNVDVGTLVDNGSANGKATELFHLADIHRLRVYVPVPEAEIPQLDLSRSIYFTLPAKPGQRWSASLSHQAGAIDPATHTELLELQLDNPGGLLLPGSYLEAHFQMRSANGVLVLPANTLIFRATGTAVAVVDENHRVHLQPVQVGRDLGDTLEILSGIRATDAVVLSPPDSLAEGESVVVQPARRTP